MPSGVTLFRGCEGSLVPPYGWGISISVANKSLNVSYQLDNIAASHYRTRLARLPGPVCARRARAGRQEGAAAASEWRR